MKLPSCFCHKVGNPALNFRVKDVTVTEESTVQVMLGGRGVLRKTTEATSQTSWFLGIHLTVRIQT